MPRVNIERVIEKLEYELKASMKSALDIAAPGKGVDLQSLFKEFKKQVIKNCKQWEYVDSNTVDTD
jgi:hypothetical protein